MHVVLCYVYTQMMRYMRRTVAVRLCVASAVLALAGMAVAIPVDPRNPAAYRIRAEASAPPALSAWLPNRIKQLEAERNHLLGEISRLPQHAPRVLSDHLGYHSLPGDETGSSSSVEIRFEFDPGLGAIAMVPALVPGESGSYAFPKRFKIEVLDRGARWVGDVGGEWVVPPPPYTWTEVVNWMEEDFPDPGAYPVFFEIEEELRINQVRLTMRSDGNDAAFHALGELYLFRDPDNVRRLGDNMMTWHNVTIHASSALSKPPLWNETFLNDGIAGLGMPLSEEVSDADDVMIYWKAGEVHPDPVQIVLDLGRIVPVGRVQLWPARAPQGMVVPHFGFPGNVTVELSVHPDFEDAVRFEVADIRDHLYTDSLLNIITSAEKARYIRIRPEDLDTYKGRTILGLGEIRVAEFDDVWSLNCAVSSSGIPETERTQLPRLVDGFCRGRRILREVEWIQGLAQRRPLDRRLAAVERELELAREAWSGFKLRAAIRGGALLVLGLAGAMGLQGLQRRSVLKKLKHRITRDLHDEVGSSLGSINLAARRMENSGSTKEELAELSLMAREASASLKDVVWVIDQSKIHLADLLQKLGERAGRVLSGVKLDVALPEHCPDRVVPLTFKRHLLMFFKEAIHN